MCDIILRACTSAMLQFQVIIKKSPKSRQSSGSRLELLCYFSKFNSISLKKLQIKGWCAEAGEGIKLEYEQKDPKNGVTRLDDSNSFWVAFKKATDDL